MASLAEIRDAAREHGRQLDALRFATVQQLAARWAVDEDVVREVPREALPYITLGKSRIRRYNPRHVEAFEQGGGIAAAGKGTEEHEAQAEQPEQAVA